MLSQKSGVITKLSAHRGKVAVALTALVYVLTADHVDASLLLELLKPIF